MKVSKRLKAIADIVNKDSILVDIGCDHGFLSAYLLLNNHIKYAYALDINKLPLDSAYQCFKEYNLLDKTKCILSNGLTNLEDNDYETIVIAGMGGSLIIDIINNDLDRFKLARQIILQPQINSYGLRKYLNDNGFKIVNEILVEEANIIYEILNIIIEKDITYNELELLYGKDNLIRKDKLLIKKMNNDLIKYQSIANRIKNDLTKIDNILNKISLIKEYLDETK